MYCIHVKDLSSTDDRGYVQVALRRGGRSNTGGLVCKTHVQRITVDIAVHGHRADAHLFASPDNSARDLAAIGNQDLAKWSAAGHNKCPNS